MASPWRGANVSRRLSNLKTLSSMEFAAATKPATTRKFSMKRSGSDALVRTEEFTPQRWRVLGVSRTFADDFCFKCLELSWWAHGSAQAHCTSTARG